ncbi:MAG: hypothetical protein GIW99_06650 [Candidatus Eremiobacteraeota bacterium]|nr:hypothetical protein [Candidatus Eremiobacteraeota bacterium]MBC5827346.1 hypothetical protein [Candidatus Eremiobacteraeota bacterium]
MASGTRGTSYEGGALFSDDAQDEGRPNYYAVRNFQQYRLSYSRAGLKSRIRVVGYARDIFVTNVADKYPTAPGVLLFTQSVPTTEGGISASWTVASANGEIQARFDERSVRGQSAQYFRPVRCRVRGAVLSKATAALCKGQCTTSVRS